MTGFYVSVIRSSRQRALLAGPFDTHGEALAQVEPARRAAEVIDPFTAFDSFGTCKITNAALPAGKLNERLGLAS